MNECARQIARQTAMAMSAAQARGDHGGVSLLLEDYCAEADRLKLAHIETWALLYQEQYALTQRLMGVLELYRDDVPALVSTWAVETAAVEHSGH